MSSVFLGKNLNFLGRVEKSKVTTEISKGEFKFSGLVDFAEGKFLWEIFLITSCGIFCVHFGLIHPN